MLLVLLPLPLLVLVLEKLGQLLMGKRLMLVELDNLKLIALHLDLHPYLCWLLLGIEM
jgi:hypothetical protein